MRIASSQATAEKAEMQQPAGAYRILETQTEFEKRLEGNTHYEEHIENRARTSKNGCTFGHDDSYDWLSTTDARRSQVSHASSSSGCNFGFVFRRFALLGFCFAVRTSELVLQVRGLCDANQTGRGRRRTASRYRLGRLCYPRVCSRADSASGFEESA